MLIDGTVPPEVVERIWRAQHDASGGDILGSALGILVEVFGVTALPSFALAVMDDDGTRVVVRGGFEAVIDDGSRTGETVRATGPTFWADRHVADATGVALREFGERAPETLPLVDGFVRARAVFLGSAERVDDLVPSDLGERRRLHDAPPTTSEPTPSPAPVVDGDAARSTSPAIATAPETPASASSFPPASTTMPAPISSGMDAESSGIPPADTPSHPATPQPATPHPAAPTETAHSDDTWSSNDHTFSTPAESSLPVEEGTTSYDDLIFGLTRVATVEDAAVRVTEEPATTPAGVIGAIPAVGAGGGSTPLGDHDGLTLSVEQLAALRAQRGSIDEAASGAPASHARGTEVTLVASTGERVALDRGAVVGLSPSAIRATGIVPHLVAVPSPLKQISRRHLEIRVEASHVLAVDLDSSNGTRLLRVGADPVRLHPGAPTLLVAGDRLDLGEGVELSFEGLQ